MTRERPKPFRFLGKTKEELAESMPPGEPGSRANERYELANRVACSHDIEQALFTLTDAVDDARASAANIEAQKALMLAGQADKLCSAIDSLTSSLTSASRSSGRIALTIALGTGGLVVVALLDLILRPG